MMLPTYIRALAIGGFAVTSFTGFFTAESIATTAATAVAIWALFSKGKKDDLRKSLADAVNENSIQQATINRLREEATVAATEIGHLKTDNARILGEKSVLEKVANGEAFLGAMQTAFKEQSDNVARIHSASSDAIVSELKSQTTALSAQAAAIEHLAKSMKPPRAPRKP